MMPHRHPASRQPSDTALRHEIEALFEEALERNGEDREHWLATQCGADAWLRAEVDSLIAAHERADGVLEKDGATAAGAALRDPNEDRRFGAYRVVRELGRGGMGVVYLAERDDGQYQQRVAIKVLRASPDAEELRRRFVAERQILASLRHSGIAQLLDGGLADGQLPYLVMQHVDGVPITTYCDQHNLGIEARLRLFGQVAAAVHYAHQNLIIHRDLKPGNILVSADGQVKLLDFGIAKLLNPAFVGIDQSVTLGAYRAMTPEYASPEQVRGQPLATPSDVYALGVVLYELLSGRRPYYLTSHSLKELTDVVCSQVPERPSVAASRALPAALQHAPGALSPDMVARARGEALGRLRDRLSGDLDAIVMMALRKEAGDRYGSVDLLWQDLQRFLDGMPVMARRGSRLYRARKFCRRHRVETVATAAIVMSLTAGAVVAVRQATVARRERAEAEQSLSQSEAVTGFLVGLFDATSVAPGGGALTAQELLRRGALKLESLVGQPLVQARMLETMGRVHITRAAYPEAEAALDRSLALRIARLGPEHPEVARTLFYMADVQRRMAHFRTADSLSRRALAIRIAAFGPRHPAVAEILGQRATLLVYLADLHGAETLSRRALEIRRASLPPNDPLIGVSLELHASHLRRLARIDEAETEFRDGIRLYRASGGPQSPDAAYLELRLADMLYEARGDTVQAEALMREGLAITRTQLGEDHPRTGWAMGDLAWLLSLRGQHVEAERLAREGLAIEQRAFGKEHPNVADFARLLADVYMRAGRLGEAEQVQRQALAIFGASLGSTHSAFAVALGSLAEVLMAEGRFDDAIDARRQAIEIRRRVFGENVALYGIDMAALGQVYARKGDYPRADSLFRLALANQLRVIPDNHPDVRQTYGFMAERYRHEGQLAQAEHYAALAMPR